MHFKVVIKSFCYPTGQRFEIQCGHLLFHFCFEFSIDHEPFLLARFWVEKFDADVDAFQLESPNVLLLRPRKGNETLSKKKSDLRFDMYADFIYLKKQWQECLSLRSFHFMAQKYIFIQIQISFYFSRGFGVLGFWGFFDTIKPRRKENLQSQ